MMQVDQTYSVRPVSRVIGWGLFVVSMITVCGYTFGIPALYAPWMGRDGMSFASAVCFLLLSLHLLYSNYVRGAQCC
jgi:hypothetical protein